MEAFTSGFLRRAHGSLCGRLAPADRTSPDGRVVSPGTLRLEDSAVGRHHPPGHASVPAFLARADDVYGRATGLDSLLCTIAAAHHRYAWVHPFLDGRGNLSEKMLRAGREFFIEVCEDQVRFMGQMLDLEDLKKRIAAFVTVRGETVSSLVYRKEILLPPHHIIVAGPISRGEFTQMTGLSERTVRDVIRGLLKDGLLTSDSHKGPLGIAFPLAQPAISSASP